MQQERQVKCSALLGVGYRVELRGIEPLSKKRSR